MRAHLAHATILCALVTSACGAEPAVATDTATATAPPGDTATSAPPDTATGDDGAADVGERDGDAAPAVAIVGARLLGAPGVADGGVAVLVLEGGVIARVGGDVPAGAEVVDLSGRFVVPAFIDSHVHLLYRPEAAEMLSGGVGGAVDMAAPVRIFDPAEVDFGALEVVAAGPMVTALGGYPTQSWGRDGYGLEVPNADAGRAAVAKLAGLGARFIKVPFQGEAQLSDEIAAAVIDEAHLRGLRVAVHALGDADAARAGRLGADILAHTPVEPLQPATLDLWAGKTVVSTLGAFGGADSTVANLRALRERGATVLYGTDFGNTTVAGVDPRELTLLSRAGLDGAAVLAAGTTAPATFWGFADLGALAPGKAATFMVLRDDPRVVPSTLSSPASVWVRGLATGGGVGAGGSRGGRGG